MNPEFDTLRQVALASPDATLDLRRFVSTIAETLNRRGSHDTEPDGRWLWTFADPDGECWGVSMPRPLPGEFGT